MFARIGDAANTHRLLTVALAGLLLAIMIPSTGKADTFGNGPPDEGYRADTSLHTYCFSSAFDDALKDNAKAAMNNALAEQTVMTVDLVSCESTTDVRWRDADLPGGTRGTYACTSPTDPQPGDTCFASTVTLDPAELNEGTNDQEDKTKTACHEVGHSVGLQHGDNKSDCMINGELPSLDIQWRRYSDHHIFDHINPTYR